MRIGEFWREIPVRLWRLAAGRSPDFMKEVTDLGAKR